MPVIPQTFNESNPRFEKNPNDVYITPYEVAHGCVKWLWDNSLCLYDRFLLEKVNVIDVGCGTGVWGKAVKEVIPNSHLSGYDIDISNINNLEPHLSVYKNDVYDTILKKDYLTADTKGFNLIIGNPPYSSKDNRHLAEDIVLKSLDMLDYGDYLGLLLKTEFLASKRRYENIFAEQPPLYVLQMVNRINWSGAKSGNTIEYAFFVWRKGSMMYPQIQWLDWKNC